MNAVIPANFGGVSAKFASVPVTDELSSGVQTSFGIIGYKGKVWSIRYRGDEEPLMRDDGDGPRSSIEVVVVKASTHISKIWYENGYVEGSNAAPDCFSNTGVTPEPTSAKPQCASCAACPHNMWGSRITPAGKAGKACADSKRLAVVPMNDMANEAYGGPMLLRVPAASLQDMAAYGDKMKQMGYPTFSIATRIQFDTAESYPKFLFNAVRPLSDEEADVVLALRDSHAVNRILSEDEFAAPALPPSTADVNAAFEQPPENPTQPKPETNTVGDQARAVAAKQAEEAKAKAAADAKAKKAAEAKAAKKAALEKELAEAEAAANAGATSEGNEESEEDREIREMEERMAALKAKKQAAAQQGTTASGSQQSTEKQVEASRPNTGQTAQTTASPSEEDGNMVSDFEADLDNMLNDLLPAG